MLFRALNIIMALNFLFSVAVQYNDPDPIPWMTLYGLAALISAAAAFSPTRYRWYVSGLVCVGAGLWALSLAPHIVGRFRFGDMFAAWEMKNLVVEEARETFGLTIAAVWMLVLTIARLRADRKTTAAFPSVPGEG